MSDKVAAEAMAFAKTQVQEFRESTGGIQPEVERLLELVIALSFSRGWHMCRQSLQPQEGQDGK